MRDVSEKVAFITGGASGIGFGMARAFLSAGMKVVMADNSEANLADAAKQLAGSNQPYHFIRLDVTDRAAIAAAADEAESVFGAVHLLCNNAGIGYAEPMTEAGYAAWDRMFAINVGGVINGIVTFVPRMRARGEGHIVNTSSIAGILPLPDGGGIYTASKFAVRGMSESLRLALAPHGIGVSTLFPGLTRSRIMESLPEGEEDALSLSFVEAHRYAMDPLDLGGAVLDAVRENAPYIIAHPEFRDEMAELHGELMAAIRDDLPMDQRRADFELGRRNFIAELKRMSAD